MRKNFLRNIILSICSTIPVTVVAGDIDLINVLIEPSVEAPNMLDGWGFSVEGALLRGYNNNLVYMLDLPITILPPLRTGIFYAQQEADLPVIDPTYNFSLRVGVDYTFVDSANVIQLFYEHLFNHAAKDNYTNLNNSLTAEGTLREKLDGITLLSQQHIVIGPYWETTFSGGLRFAHLQQQLHSTEEAFLANLLRITSISFSTFSSQSNSQYNGVGPLLGLGSIFHFGDGFAAGAEVQASLLIGRSTLSEANTLYIEGVEEVATIDANTMFQTHSIASIVPEAYYRIYGNYFYHFNNGAELVVEAGWRANQFFHVRTFEQLEPTTLFISANIDSIGVLGGPSNTTISDDIGFGGPYLMIHYQM